MGVPNMFLLAQACIYLLIFILSFFVCVPAGVNVSDFSGHCLLYASGTWEQQSGSTVGKLSYVDWGPDSACNFTIFLGVISLILALFYLVWTALLLARGIESSWLDAFLNLVVNSVMCVCFFSTALAVSVGFRDWCELITDHRSGLDKCENGQYIEIGSDIGVNTNNYYVQWQIAQFGVWCTWISWLVLAVMALVRMYSYHRQEAFMVSINRERQRLLARVGTGTEPA